MTNSSPPKRVTISDVSRLAQVSTATVSRVINRSAFVSESAAARVMAAIERLNYVPNSSAQVPAGGKTNTLDLIVPEIGCNISPLLTTIHADFQKAGSQATVTLAKLTSKVPTKSKVLLPTTLVTRHSCGC